MADPLAQRTSHDGPVCREVGRRDQPLVVAARLGNPLAELAGIDIARAVGGDPGPAVGQVGIAQQIAGLQYRTVRPGEGGVRLRVLAEEVVRGQRQIARRRRADPEPLAGRLLGRRDGLRPGTRAMAVMRELQSAQGAR